MEKVTFSHANANGFGRSMTMWPWICKQEDVVDESIGAKKMLLPL